VPGPEEPLAGGFISTVVRAGDTVRRPAGPNTDFVRRLLGHLESAGWRGAPRFLGIDEHGREVLEFVGGQVPWQPGQLERVSGDACLSGAGALVREFHDLTAGTELAGAAEVVCHNDLSPKNTVYRDGGSGCRPVALIDWDLAAPGERIHDIAHLCWQYADLGPRWQEPHEAARRMRALCDGYRLADRSPVLDAVLWWQDRCWRGIMAGARAGDPAMARLRDAGSAAAVRDQYEWVLVHRDQLQAAL
jgi:hypothetical protein